MINSELLRDQGYVLIKNVFTLEQINQLRSDIVKYFNIGGGFSNCGGKAKPDWLSDDRCESLKWLIDYKPLKNLLSDYIGENYEFLEHNDIHINRIVGYHKDRLSGAGQVYEKINPWEDLGGVTQQIYKVNIYLQDHTNDDNALAIKEGTHNTEVDDPEAKEIGIKPGIGDIVIFDQRLTHRGQLKQYKIPRMLISLGYGIPNQFSEQFKIGTMARQNDQNKNLKQ